MIQVGSLWRSDCECHHTSPCKSGVMHHMAVLLDGGSEVGGSIVASNVLDLGTHHVDRSDSASIQYRSPCNALCKAIGVYSEYPEQLAGTCFGCWRIIRVTLRWRAHHFADLHHASSSAPPPRAVQRVSGGPPHGPGPEEAGLVHHHHWRRHCACPVVHQVGIFPARDYFGNCLVQKQLRQAAAHRCLHSSQAIPCKQIR